MTIGTPVFACIRDVLILPGGRVMGTPKNSWNNSLKAPSLSEKRLALNLFHQVKMSFKLNDVALVFVAVTSMLLPLVEWLDKTLRNCLDGEIEFDGMENHRVMLLFNGYGMGFQDIMLNRIGYWMVRDDKEILTLNPAEFAQFILEKSDKLLEIVIRDDEMRKFINDNDFLKEIAQRYSLVWFLSRIFENIDKQITEREERIKIMRKRLSVFHDLSESLDPIARKKDPMYLPNHTIFDGGHLAAGSYLSPSALDGFWKIAKERTGGGYSARDVVVEINSLDDLLSRVGYMVREIEEAKRNGHTDARSLWGYSSGRLPFLEEELIVLKEIVAQIKG